MKIIQVTGLPGVGKTTGILNYLSTVKSGHIELIDLANFSGYGREAKAKTAALAANKPVILESACGIKKLNSYLIRIEDDIKTIYHRLIERDKELDADYLSLLHSQMLPAHCTIKTASDLPVLLKKLIKGVECIS